MLGISYEKAGIVPIFDGGEKKVTENHRYPFLLYAASSDKSNNTYNAAYATINKNNVKRAL